MNIIINFKLYYYNEKGLDPAGPLFHMMFNESLQRLNTNDAR